MNDSIRNYFNALSSDYVADLLGVSCVDEDGNYKSL